MYRYSEKGYKNIASAYREYEKKLKTINDNLSAYSERTNDFWTGDAGDEFRSGLSKLQTEGDLYYLWHSIFKMRNILDKAATEIVSLHNNAEMIGSTIDCGLGNGVCDIVAYNQDKKSTFDMCINNAESRNEELKGNIYAVFEKNNGIVNLADESSLATKAYNNIMKLNALKARLDSYAKKIEEFDKELNSQFTRISNLSVSGASTDPTISDDYVELMKRLKSNDMTMEEYNSLIFDAMMYLDVFDEHVNENEEVTYVPDKELLDHIKDGTCTVKEYIDKLGKITDYKEGDCAGYFQIVKNAIETNPELGRYVIVKSSRLEGYNEGTNGMILKAPDSDTYYVTWRGTSGLEWIDDAERIGVKSADKKAWTTQMKEVVEFFDDFMEGRTTDDTVYVTGHSQGGNDAQICMLLSEYPEKIDACYSVDGEGHSPELIADLKKKLGDEYYDRVSKMFAINGYDDPVSHFGEIVISKENTIQINSDISSNYTYAHDMKGLFGLNNDNKLTGLINERKEGISTIATLGSNLWEQLNELPPDKRKSCAVSLLAIFQQIYNNGFNIDENTFKTIDGTGPDIEDFIDLFNHGFGVLGDAITVTGIEEIKKKIREITGSDIIDDIFDAGMDAAEFCKHISNIRKWLVNSPIFAKLKLQIVNAENLVNTVTIFGGGLMAMGTDLWNGVSDAYNVFTDAARKHILLKMKWFTDHKIKDYVLTEWYIWNEYADEMLNTMVNTFSNVLEEGIGIQIDYINSQINYLKKRMEIGNDLFNGIKSEFDSGIQHVKDFGDDMKNLGDDVVDKVVDVGEGISDGIDSAIDWIFD